MDRAVDAFEERFGATPAWVVRSPGRVNLIGEHTDYNEGFVLPMAIDRAVGLALRPRRDDRVLLHSLDQAEPADFRLGALERAPSGWAEYPKGMARALLDEGHALVGFEGIVASDVPIGSGLSSSAALEMAVGLAFARASGFPFDGVEMARCGQRAENDWVGARTGIMDQMVCANAEPGAALLIDCRSLATRPVALPEGVAIVVMDTMTRHDHTSSGYNERRTSCEAAAAALGLAALRDASEADLDAAAAGLEPRVRRRARHVVSENRRVLEAVEAMQAADVPWLGRLMDASHASLRDDFEVSSEALDQMVAIAREAPGCHGARMTGGGFGGCAIALVDAPEAEALAASVAARYAEATGRRPDVFATHASGGVAVV